MSDINSIDYTPLNAINNAWGKVYRASFNGHGKVANTLILVVGVALIFLDGIGFGVLLLWFIGMSLSLSKYKNQAWQDFAGANGWGLDESMGAVALVPPSLIYGHSQHFSPIIQAQLGQLDCELFTYQYTVGEGKYQQTFVFTVAHVLLEHQLPHMVLFSKQAHPRMENDLDNHEQLKLEGDFNDYFKLEVEKGQEVDALTILTPDVMQALVNFSRAEDIEIYGDDLFFIMNSDKRDPNDVKQLISSVDGLASQINQNIRLATSPTPPPPAIPPPVAAATPPPTTVASV